MKAPKKIFILLLSLATMTAALNVHAQTKEQAAAAAQKKADKEKAKADKKAAKEKAKAEKQAQATTTTPPAPTTTPSAPPAPKTTATQPVNKSADKAVGTDAKGRTIYEGPRGGRYILTKNGNKEYIKKN